jgi:hypothetical protein
MRHPINRSATLARGDDTENAMIVDQSIIGQHPRELARVGDFVLNTRGQHSTLF